MSNAGRTLLRGSLNFSQQTVAAMQKSAASLTGAMGTSLKQQAIPAVGKRSVSVAKAAAKGEKGGYQSAMEKHVKSGGKVGAQKAMTSKEKLLAENAAKK